MRIGLNLHRLHAFGADPDACATVARKAEELGFESLWVGDHLVFPQELPPTYPYSPDGRGPHHPSLPWYDAFVSLTWLAAATRTIRLGTDVYVLPLRHPFVTARAVATLDLLSRGRTILGVGVGWMDAEFQRAGESFHDRGRRTDEIIHVLKRLWMEEVVEHEGPRYPFGPVYFEPKPAATPHPPIHIGGNSPAAMRRAAAVGNGWIGVAGALPDIPAAIRRVHELRRKHGRDRLPFEVTMGLANPTVDRLRQYEEWGVQRATLIPWDAPMGAPVSVDLAVAGMERFAETVMARLAG